MSLPDLHLKNNKTLIMWLSSCINVNVKVCVYVLVNGFANMLLMSLLTVNEAPNGKMINAAQHTLFPWHVICLRLLLYFHTHIPLVISLRGVAPPTICPICVAALKAWQTPPLIDSLQPTCLTSSVSRTRLMEMADQLHSQSSKRREMSNQDLICEFPWLAPLPAIRKSLTVLLFIPVHTVDFAILKSFSYMHLRCQRE